MDFSKLAIPGAIVLAGALIATGLFFSRSEGSKLQKTPVNDPEKTDFDPASFGEQNVSPITENDHVFGNPDAPVKIIEFSDLECPFCKQFHSVMEQVVEEYEGKVARVYRHFPLPQIHPNAPKQAEATECAAELGGNDAFWKYLDRIFEITPSNNGLDMRLLPEIAEYIGLDKTAFQQCLDSRKYAGKIADYYNDAIRSGGKATPYSIIITKDGTKKSIPGSLPFSSMKIVIDSLLKEDN